MKKRLVLGILAHVDAGKTTLSEGLLYTGGSIRKMGRVDNQDAFLDTHALERERGITIFSKQAMIYGKDVEITLLDTPGHVDFGAEMERTLQVLDGAILVVSASDGIKGHTLTLWKLLHKYGVPVFIFVNKMDQEGAQKEALLQLIRDNLSSECVDFSRPDTQEFYETIATSDEALLNQFLETGKVEKQDIVTAIAGRAIFPCCFGSALKYQGVKEFLDILEQYASAPRYPKEFRARVFKIARDEQNNRLTYLKVTGGRLRVKDMVSSGVSHEEGECWEEKINQIRIYSGMKYETVNEAEAGMVCTVTGLTRTKPGDGLGMETDSGLPVLEPVLTYQIILPQEVDAAQMLPKLRQLEEEEPQLHIVWDEKLKEIQAQLMGEVQIEILKRLIKERFDVTAAFGTGNIVYKETIANTVEGVGHFEPLRHYAEVHLLLEPGEPQSGLIFTTSCSEDILERNWQRLILTHLEEKEHRGVLTGSPITDMKITLIAGRSHVKHTEGGDFRQATYRALRQGLMQAQSVLLEPFYEFVLEIPQSAVGKAMTDMDKMSGTFVLEESPCPGNIPGLQEPMAVLKGSAPVACLRDYATQVAAYSKGHGRLSCTLLGYRPCHNSQEVVEKLQYHPQEDVENTADSVFCMHGVGSVVHWDEVHKYMHMEGMTVKSREEEAEGMRPLTGGRSSASEETVIDIDEIDRILERTFYANRKDKFIPHKGIAAGRRTKGSGAPGALKGSGAGAPVIRSYDPKPMREQYLLVDGYNVIFAWEELKELAQINIDAARGQLQDILCNYQAIRHYNLILVFDAYKIVGHGTEYSEYHNIHLVYTKEAETADQYIEHFAHENGRKYDVTVVTSDGLEQIIIRGQGCKLISSREFAKEVEDALEEFRGEYLSKTLEKGNKNYLLDSMSEEEIRKMKE